MSLSIGIVGLPNVGKSTLFKTLTKKEVDIANYPFCTIDPNVGVVLVPDERVDKLAELSKSKKKIYATVDFVDIAGLVKGAAQGEDRHRRRQAYIQRRARQDAYRSRVRLCALCACVAASDIARAGRPHWQDDV